MCIHLDTILSWIKFRVIEVEPTANDTYTNSGSKIVTLKGQDHRWYIDEAITLQTESIDNRWYFESKSFPFPIAFQEDHKGQSTPSIVSDRGYPFSLANEDYIRIYDGQNDSATLLYQIKGSQYQWHMAAHSGTIQPYPVTFTGTGSSGSTFAPLFTVWPRTDILDLKTDEHNGRLLGNEDAQGKITINASARGVPHHTMLWLEKSHYLNRWDVTVDPNWSATNLGYYQVFRFSIPN